MAGVICDCPAPSGFTNLGNIDSYQWWVHAGCGFPTEPWLRAQGEDVLNFFRGGPFDGTAYTTDTLIGKGVETDQLPFLAQIREYNWTPEVIVSPTTGASARVWTHKSLGAPALIDETAQAPVSASAAAAGPSSPASSQEEGADMAAKKKTAEAAPTGNLEERRKAGGFSRNQVAEAAGLTAAKVYRIEKGGARTTEEETAAVVAGLEALEAANAS